MSDPTPDHTQPEPAAPGSSDDVERHGVTDGSGPDAPAIDEAPADAGTTDDAELPSTDELEEPSTEKTPDEEPKAPSRHEEEPSHHATGIGVIDEE